MNRLASKLKNLGVCVYIHIIMSKLVNSYKPRYYFMSINIQSNIDSTTIMLNICNFLLLSKWIQSIGLSLSFYLFDKSLTIKRTLDLNAAYYEQVLGILINFEVSQWEPIEILAL